MSQASRTSRRFRVETDSPHHHALDRVYQGEAQGLHASILDWDPQNAQSGIVFRVCGPVSRIEALVSLLHSFSD